MRTYTLSIQVDERDYQTLARAVAGVLTGFARHGRPMEWTIENELEYLLREALRRERFQQQDRDDLARELGAQQAKLAQQLGLGDDAPAAPEWLRKLLDDVEGGA